MLPISTTQRAAIEEVCRRFRVERLEVFGAAIDAARREWDCPTVIATLDAKRRLSIPVTLAPAKPGDQFDATFDAEKDTVILRRVPKKRSWLEVLKRCPVSMDDLPPRSRELPKKLKLCSTPLRNFRRISARGPLVTQCVLFI